VLLLVGDNDSYPLWYLQLAERARADVTPVTIPLLGAPWYRAELARRHDLLPRGSELRWEGLPATLRLIASAARRQRRPLVVSAAVPDTQRAHIGTGWTLTGVAWRWTPERGVDSVDTAAVAGVARRISPRLFAPVRDGTFGTEHWAQQILRCPATALEAARQGRSASLEAACNPK
jgi:hypothetical protein